MLERILQQPIIPVVEIESAHLAEPLAEAVLNGGIHILEVVLRTEQAVEAIRIIRRQLPELLVGAGTVLTETQAAQVIDAGAQFGVAPGLNSSVVEHFHRNNLPFIPGVMTPSEIEAALQQDCTFLKFFPAEAAGGVRYLKSISGPYQHTGIQFCATGGVSPDNINEYLDLPIVSAIGGSWLASREQIRNQQWQQISNQIATAMKSINHRTGLHLQ